nr:hypothetical protein CFP56_00597 [Quercus suber]
MLGRVRRGCGDGMGIMYSRATSGRGVPEWPEWVEDDGCRGLLEVSPSWLIPNVLIDADRDLDVVRSFEVRGTVGGLPRACRAAGPGDVRCAFPTRPSPSRFACTGRGRLGRMRGGVTGGRCW